MEGKKKQLREEQYEQEIVKRSEQILRSYEDEGFQTAFRLWQNLDQQLRSQRDDLSEEVSNLIIEIGLFMEDYPDADLSNFLRALYLAKVSLGK